MKKLIIIGMVLAGAGAFAAEKVETDALKLDKNMQTAGKSAQTENITWIDAKDIPMEGNAFWPESRTQFVRLPPDAKDKVRKAVWGLSHHCAGLCFRFSTDSDFIELKFKFDQNPGFAYQRVPDIYRWAEEKQSWRFVNCDIYTKSGWKQPWIPGEQCMIYLPNYAVCQSFQIGIKPGTTIKALPPRKNGQVKPVVVYGTSITQGAWATRPGLAYLNIVQRKLDVPMVNLGFSGNGSTEFAMGEYLAQIDASCYVIDTQHNSGYEAFHEKGDQRAIKLLKYLRERRPDVPIVLCQGACAAYKSEYPYMDYKVRKLKRTNDAIAWLYNHLKSEGWQKLYLLEADALMPEDGEGTVDHAHPNDWGMMHLANGYAEAIKTALGM